MGGRCCFSRCYCCFFFFFSFGFILVVFLFISTSLLRYIHWILFLLVIPAALEVNTHLDTHTNAHTYIHYSNCIFISHHPAEESIYCWNWFVFVCTNFQFITIKMCAHALFICLLTNIMKTAPVHSNTEHTQQTKQQKSVKFNTTKRFTLKKNIYSDTVCYCSLILENVLNVIVW